MGMAVCRLDLDKGVTRFWLAFKPVVLLTSPYTVESMLTNTKNLDKSDEYFVFEPWLGQGLVTSKRNKWQFRRKILTPAFHFRILAEQLPIINNEATRLVQKLSNKRYSKGQRTDIVPLVTQCTLDSICETAMGVKVDCQADENESQYVRALYEVGENALARVARPWMWPDFVFYRTDYGRKFVKARDYMHSFTRGVIEKRKAEWEEILEKTGSSDDKMTLDEIMQLKYGQTSHKQMVFLDLLLHQHLIEKTMTLNDVQEEVDTFMFAVSLIIDDLRKHSLYFPLDDSRPIPIEIH